MSSNPAVTATPPTPPPPQAASPAAHPSTVPNSEIKIVSHSNIFYWWPVWAIGLVMAGLTLYDGHRMVLVTSDAEARRDWQVVTGTTTTDSGASVLKTTTREGILLEKGHLLPDKAETGSTDLPKPLQPYLRTASTSGYGVIWATVLLLVIVITNVPLRGLWSVIVIVLILLVSVIFGLLEWWTKILETLSALDIRINMGGYLFISLILLGIWLVSNLFFDRQVYMVFTPGQLKVCLEVGGGETSYDTMGMVIQKQRDDLFRHWVLGLGSGDLIVRTSGANAHEFQLPNVLFVGHKLQLIEEMQRDRPMVKG